MGCCDAEGSAWVGAQAALAGAGESVAVFRGTAAVVEDGD